jgi:hypothetical protein
MDMIKRAQRFSRRGPDFLTEEIAAVLSADLSYEFKSLFEVVQMNLRDRSVARGDKEMFRLRTYEKLQNMVQSGVVIRDGKTYRGDHRKLPAFREQLLALNSQEALHTAAARQAAGKINKS